MSETKRVRLVLNGGAPRWAAAGRPLLDALHDVGVFPPSACGGEGLCGQCRVRVLEGAPAEITDAEKDHLKGEELARGYRLACQVRLDRDVSLEVPEDYFAAREYGVKVSAVSFLNYDTVRLTLSFAEGTDFRFTAGQYVRLEIPPYGGLAEPVTRAYSVASPPSRTAELELIVRKVPQGLETTYIHELLRTGQTLRLDGPYGEFTLRPGLKAALFIGGGSGIAPFESILADMAEKGADRPVTLFFGAARRADLYDLDKFADLARRLPGLRFVPVVACPQPGDGWQGETGLVTEAVARLFPSLAGMEAYLCGSARMIDACLDTLTRLGMKPEDVFFDKYT